MSAAPLALVLLVHLATQAQDTIFFSPTHDTLPTARGADRYEVSRTDPMDSTLVLVTQHLSNGHMMQERRIRGRKGVQVGEWRWWDEHGQLIRLTTYAEGKWEGPFRTWWPNGAARRDDVYDANELVRGTCRDSLGQELEWFPFEVMPAFPGGEKELFAYLAANTKYPRKARKAGRSGLVVVQFVVDRTGAIQRAEIRKSVDPDLDTEALRVVMAMPRWFPGQVDGQPVKVSYSLPIRFTLR